MNDELGLKFDCPDEMLPLITIHSTINGEIKSYPISRLVYSYWKLSNPTDRKVLVSYAGVVKRFIASVEKLFNKYGSDFEEWPEKDNSWRLEQMEHIVRQGVELTDGYVDLGPDW
ncbi:hypothetical protein LCGC14_2613330 [marine sediment metagenome]|uniref:Uncharacterized protein n=1 Tax=marine sediment metagenome TaxID=412755 RepID=A0A0F9A5H6_9ZZZZ